MDKDKKKRGGRGYLNDFERDLTGRYHYRGKMYHYRGTLPRQRVLGLLWAGAAVAQVLLLAAGCLDGQGLRRCFYVLLPYVAAFVANVSVCWALGRLTAGGDPLREYVYQASVAKLPMRSMLTAVFSAAAALMCLVHILLNGAAALSAHTQGREGSVCRKRSDRRASARGGYTAPSSSTTPAASA